MTVPQEPESNLTFTHSRYSNKTPDIQTPHTKNTPPILVHASHANVFRLPRFLACPFLSLSLSLSLSLVFNGSKDTRKHPQGFLLYTFYLACLDHLALALLHVITCTSSLACLPASSWPPLLQARRRTPQNLPELPHHLLFWAHVGSSKAEMNSEIKAVGAWQHHRAASGEVCRG